MLQIKEFDQWATGGQPCPGRPKSRSKRRSGGDLSLHYHNPVAIRFGAGSLDELPAILAGRRAVVVTIPEAEALGLTARLRTLLGPALAAVYDRVEPNP